MGRNIKYMAGEKGKLMTCLQQPQKSQPPSLTVPQIPATSVVPNFVSSAQWNPWALLTSQGGNCPHTEAGNSWATL